MMPTRSRRPLSPAELLDRRSKRTLVLGISMTSFVVLATVGSFWLATKWNPVLSGVDLCRVGRTPIEEAIILLDATDPWNRVQQEVIRQEFRNLQSSIPRHARITLFTLDSEFDGLPVPALQLCNPGSAEDFQDFPIIGADGVRLVANPDTIERRWVEGFVSKLDKILQMQAAGAGSNRSPLLETIRGAAITVYGVADAAPPSKRTMYVFSDLLQNSSLYSHYREPRWTGNQGRALADLSVAGTLGLKDAEVSLFLLDRGILHAGPGRGPGALMEFWEAFFAEQGATVIRVRRIEG